MAATPVPASATFPGANGRIAFASAANGNFDIHTTNPDGTRTVDVADVSGFDVEPDYARDGTKMAPTRPRSHRER